MSLLGLLLLPPLLLLAGAAHPVAAGEEAVTHYVTKHLREVEALSPLEKRVFNVVSRAWEAAGGRGKLYLDPILFRGAEALNRHSNRGDEKPAQMVQGEIKAILSRAGVYDHFYYPYAAVVSNLNLLTQVLGPEEVRLAAREDENHLGLSVLPTVSGRGLRIGLILARRGFQLQRFPREVTVGARHTLIGRLVGGWKSPSVEVTTPRGPVRNVPVRQSGRGGFRATLDFDEGPGEYQVEVIGKNASGPSPVALFSVFAGGEVEVDRTPGPDSHAVDENDVARQMLAMVNLDRRLAGLTELAWNDGLARHAVAYSQDMVQRDYFAHVTPEGRALGDRIDSKALGAERLAENIALNATPSGAHQGLMDSPGHRKNILDPGLTHIGIGAARMQDEDGKDLWVITEEFAQLRKRVDPRKALRWLTQQILAQRQRRGLPYIAIDPQLGRLARLWSQRMQEADSMSDTLPRYGTLKSFIQKTARGMKEATWSIALNGKLSETLDSPVLYEPRYQRLGIGVHQGDSRRHGKALYWITFIAVR